jgi:hypothetical protein
MAIWEHSSSAPQRKYSDIPQMTSKTVEIVPPFHRRENTILFAAIRWLDFGDRSTFGKPFAQIFRHSADILHRRRSCQDEALLATAREMDRQDEANQKQKEEAQQESEAKANTLPSPSTPRQRELSVPKVVAGTDHEAAGLAAYLRVQHFPIWGALKRQNRLLEALEDWTARERKSTGAGRQAIKDFARRAAA